LSTSQRTLGGFLLRLSVLPLLVLLWALGYGTHEMGHNLMANVLGIPTEIHFGFWWGRTVYLAGEPVLWKTLLIGLAGPWLTTSLYAGMWWISAKQIHKSVWELDNVVAPATLTIFWFFYGIGDAFNFVGTSYAGMAGMVVGILAPAWLYRRYIGKLFSDERVA